MLAGSGVPDARAAARHLDQVRVAGGHRRGVYLARGSLVGLDAGAALLVAAFVLKMLEMNNHRDARVLIFLGFFCVAVGYLFEDNLLWALFSLLPVGALLAALIGLQHADLAGRSTDTLKLAFKLMAQAVPLMLVLFLFFHVWTRFGRCRNRATRASLGCPTTWHRATWPS